MPENQFPEKKPTETSAQPAPGRSSRLALLKGQKPAAVQLSGDEIKFDRLDGAWPYPLLGVPAAGPVNVHSWIKNNRTVLEGHLHQWGAVLLRGFAVDSANSFYTLLRSFGKDLLEYTVRSSPRHEVQKNVYTSTDHPSDQVINLHNENSYSHEWPLKILFYCLQPPLEGGETPIADSRAVLKELLPATREQFRQRGVLYVRNLGGGLGLHWSEVFQTQSRAEVEAYCREHGMQFRWTGADQLQLRYTRPAIRVHPVTGEEVWFNHAFFFHPGSLEAPLREALARHGDADTLPYVTFYGDGAPIEDAVIEELRAAYRRHTVSFPWQAGDVLVLDNMLMTHGRNPFTGDRKILVGMLEPYSG